MLLLLTSALAAPLTTAEVGRHDRPDDCLTVIDGTVYDLTPFIAAHPGGEAIARACGKDASWFFHNRDEAGGHSPGATAMLATFALGPLGAETQVIAPVEPVHPFETRLEGSRAGLLPTSGVGPTKSVALRVGHQLSTGDAPTGIAMALGYSTGWLDVLVSDARALGLGALELKVRPLAQHGSKAAPVSVAISGGGGFSSTQDQPALFGQLIAERDLMDRKLTLRGVGIGALSPGVQDSGTASAGLALEFRPIPIHSVFVEALVPLSAPDQLRWSAGARLFTQGHSFSLYVASTPAISPYELAGPTADQLAIGAAFERAFRL